MDTRNCLLLTVVKLERQCSLDLVDFWLLLDVALIVYHCCNGLTHMIECAHSESEHDKCNMSNGESLLQLKKLLEA